MLHYLRAMAVLVAILLARMTYVLTQSQEFSAVMISDTLPFSRSFVIASGQRLDLAMVMRQVDARLKLLSAPPQLALLRQADMGMPLLRQPDPDRSYNASGATSCRMSEHFVLRMV
jgi:hypothetical protein